MSIIVFTIFQSLICLNHLFKLYIYVRSTKYYLIQLTVNRSAPRHLQHACSDISLADTVQVAVRTITNVCYNLLGNTSARPVM